MQKISFSTSIEICGDDIDVSVEADYYAGCPERGPTYDCGGTPEEPPELDITEVCTKNQKGEWIDISWLLPEAALDHLKEYFFEYVHEDYKKERRRY